MKWPAVNIKESTKALQIDKAQSSMIIVIAIGTIITVFSLTSTKALMSKAIYQNRVIQARHNSSKQLKEDIKNADTLVTQFKTVFEGTSPTNVIGGKNDPSPGAQPPDGDNARVVLDALPTNYDFPALLTSMSKLLNSNGIGGSTIGGSDQSATNASAPVAKPEPHPIDLTLGGTGDYAKVQKLVNDLERSIRPFDITSLTLSGNESSLVATMNLITYYQTAKTVNINSKEIH